MLQFHNTPGNRLSGIKIPIRRVWINLIAGWAATLVLTAAPAGAFDFSSWDALVKKHVRPTTRDGIRFNSLPYKLLKTDSSFKKLVRDLEAFSPEKLKTRNEKLAFWINAYNIFAVKMVLDHYPIKSIKKAGRLGQSVWNKPVGKVGGKTITLNDIEHETLRKMGEPLIHTAIVCASVSCPDLRREAYIPDRLEEQLASQMRVFLTNWGKGMRIEKEEGRVHLSSIFKWFKEDFESKGGVLPFIAPYVSKNQRAVLTSGKARVSYLSYNWDLNER